VIFATASYQNFLLYRNFSDITSSDTNNQTHRSLPLIYVSDKSWILPPACDHEYINSRDEKLHDNWWINSRFSKPDVHKDADNPGFIWYARELSRDLEPSRAWQATLCPAMSRAAGAGCQTNEREIAVN